MTDSTRIFDPGWRLTDANGNPAPLGYVEVYQAGTSTPRTVYSDLGLTTAIGTTIYTDSGGAPVASSGSSTKVLVYTGTTAYKVIAKDGTGTTLWTFDNVAGALNTSSFGSGSGSASFPVVSKASTTWTIDSDAPGTLYNAIVAGGSQIASLPSAVTAGDGYMIGVRHASSGSSNTVTIQATAGQQIEGGATDTTQEQTAVVLTGYGEIVCLVADGADWTIASRTPPLIDAVGRLIIKSRLTAPPSSPAAGDRHIITGTPTGTWAALAFAEHDVVEANGVGGWTLYRPPTNSGWTAYVQAESVEYQHRTAGWTAWSNITAPAASSLRRVCVMDEQAQNTAGGTSTSTTWHKRNLVRVVANTMTTSNGAASNASLASNAVTIPAGGPYWCHFWSQVGGSSNGVSTRMRSETAVSSTSSHSVGTGSKAFTVLADQAFVADQTVWLFSTGTPTRIMQGTVTSYSGTTLTVNVTSTSGSGTSTDWAIHIIVEGSPTQAQGLGTSINPILHGSGTLTLAAACEFRLETFTANGVATTGLGAAANLPGQPERYAFLDVIDLRSLQGPQGNAGAQGATGRDAGFGRWTFSTTTTSGTSSGQVRFNSGTITSVTSIFLNETDADGRTLSAWLDTIDDSTSTVKGTLTLTKQDTPGTYCIFNVTAQSDTGSERAVTVTYVAGSLPAASDSLAVQFMRTGDVGSGLGDPGANGVVVRTSSGVTTARTITGPAAGLTVTNGNGVSGNPTIALANDLAALEALSGTNTIYYRSGADTWSAVTIGGNLTFSGGTLAATGGGGGGLANIVEDTTPQLGGNLDLNGFQITGLVIGTDVQAYDADLASWAGVTRASGFDTFAATPSSANLRSLLTDETGTGSAVFATSPTLVTPNLGTPSAATLTNATGLPVSTGLTGLGTNVATALAVNVGSAGAFVTFNGALGTPSSGTLTNATGLPISTGVSGLGSGVATWLATPSVTNLNSAVTGGPVQAAGVQEWFVPASAFVPRTTNPCASLATLETTTNRVNIDHLAFDATTQEFAQVLIPRMPKSWNESTLTAIPIWSHPSTTTNFGVVWGISGLALGDDDAADTAFGTAQTSADTGGTTDDIYHGPATSAITIGGTPAEGDTVILQVSRNPADASDTMAVDARFHGLLIRVTTNAANDA